MKEKKSQKTIRKGFPHLLFSSVSFSNNFPPFFRGGAFKGKVGEMESRGRK